MSENAVTISAFKAPTTITPLNLLTLKRRFRVRWDDSGDSDEIADAELENRKRNYVKITRAHTHTHTHKRTYTIIQQSLRQERSGGELYQ